jgi:cadmium resistance protein CadD (predicted permease)
MPTLLTILATLFIALMLLIPLIERFAPRPNAEQTAKISRWILPLVGIMLVIGLFKSFSS